MKQIAITLILIVIVLFVFAYVAPVMFDSAARTLYADSGLAKLNTALCGAVYEAILDFTPDTCR